MIAAKPRILALHGFRTSAAVLRTQVAIAGLTNFLQNHADVTFLDAPHPASGEAYPEVIQFFEPPFFEWWNATQIDDAVTDEKVWTFKGLDESLKSLERYMVENGPFDGLMGFSQGATASALIALIQQLGLGFQNVPRLKFMVLIAGQRCRDAQYLALYTTNKISCPSFVVIGEKDPQRESIDKLPECLENPVIFRHEEGHKVPRLGAAQQEALARMIRGE